MCSTNGGQLGRICRAIDELAGSAAISDRAASGEPALAAGEDGAAQAGAAHRTGAADQAGAPGRPGAASQSGAPRRVGAADQAGVTRRAGRDDSDIARLAAIWEMVADADPELAKRLPGYLSAAE